jgi:tetratricopeptide (TPR) repeat protein
MNPTDAVQRAFELSEEHRWGEAIELLERAAREHPEEQDLPLQIAELHVDRGFLRGDARALEDFDAADRWHATPRADAGRAAVLARRGDFERAESFLRLALEALPDLPEARLAEAELRRLQGRTEEALRIAIDAGAADAFGLTLLSDLLESAGRREEAWRLLESAQDRFHGSDRYLVRFAAMREAQGALGEARRALQHAGVVNPERADAARALCLLELGQGEEAAASRALQDALHRDPEGTREWLGRESVRAPALASLRPD